MKVCLALPCFSIGAELLAGYKSNLNKREMKRKKNLTRDDALMSFFGMFTAGAESLP